MPIGPVQAPTVQNYAPLTPQANSAVAFEAKVAAVRTQTEEAPKASGRGENTAKGERREFSRASNSSTRGQLIDITA